MASRRTYGDPCGIARGLDLIGDRWALLVARELLLGPKRFTDLRAGLPHLGPDVLSQRLRELEGAGVVARATLPPPAGSRVYELTDWGRELEPVLLALGRWGSRAPFPSLQGRHGSLSPDAFVIALKTTFDPAAADGFEASLELRLAGQPFRLSVGGQRLYAAHGPGDDPDAVIDTDSGTLADVLWHGAPLGDAARARRLTITGDAGVASQFLELFPAPVPAS
jgi:DNA-binding HxlR family transcriptional regulator